MAPKALAINNVKIIFFLFLFKKKSKISSFFFLLLLLFFKICKILSSFLLKKFLWHVKCFKNTKKKKQGRITIFSSVVNSSHGKRTKLRNQKTIWNFLRIFLEKKKKILKMFSITWKWSVECSIPHNGTVRIRRELMTWKSL